MQNRWSSVAPQVTQPSASPAALRQNRYLQFHKSEEDDACIIDIILLVHLTSHLFGRFVQMKHHFCRDISRSWILPRTRSSWNFPTKHPLLISRYLLFAVCFYIWNTDSWYTYYWFACLHGKHGEMEKKFIQQNNHVSTKEYGAIACNRTFVTAYSIFTRPKPWHTGSYSDRESIQNWQGRRGMLKYWKQEQDIGNDESHRP